MKTGTMENRSKGRISARGSGERTALLPRSIFLILVLLTPSTIWADSTAIQNTPAQNIPSGGRALGPATCASSNCHGSVNPRKGSPILQNEYVTWQRHDRHAKAFAALRGESALRMAKLLGISNPSTEPLCLNCHTTYLPEKDRRGEKFSFEDGVSCESCHGNAEHWIQSHTEAGTTHAINLEHGQIDLVNLKNRTTLCMSCHIGNETQYVDHRLIGAGHPRLTFDLDTFEALLPRHWSVDEDYIRRKEAYQPARAWLVGQAALAEETIDRFLSTERSHFGIMPELSNFHCYSCHHSLKESQWRSRDYAGRPGELRPNLSQLTIFGEALKVIDAKSGAEWGALLETLRNKFGREETDAELEQLQALLTTINPSLVSAQLTESQIVQIVRNLTARLSLADGTYYEDAEQTALAISSLTAQSEQLNKRHKSQLDKLYKLLRDPDRFNPKTLAELGSKM